MFSSSGKLRLAGRITRHAALRLGLRWEPSAQRPGPLLLGRIDVCRRGLPDRAAGLDQIDDAPVGVARDDQVRNRRERGLVIERLREHRRSGLVQEALRLLRSRPCAVLLDAASLGHVLDRDDERPGAAGCLGITRPLITTVR